ncbi:hypothetical protein [Candidatus Stoquefichus sp. SB1]|uniref:hypothetical protein n=1 Tax=Candidatus Stoquefichus sp. SB1 TaxID=1658109 RepID=UPI0012FF4B53|nr:hypothetical protein [Candidatus Stoquefichus sp. SB1]
MISVRITFNDGTIYEKDDITYCQKAFDCEPFKTVMQFVDIEIKNSINVRYKEFTLEFGVKADETDEYEYINWGTYIVDNDSIEKKIDTNTTKFTAYDYLKKASKNYEEMKIEYPTTLKGYLEAICNVLGYTLKTEEFANFDTALHDDKFIGNIKYTYRDILNNIAGAAGGIIYLNGSDLYIKYPTETNYVIDENNLKKLSISNEFGPLNSLGLTIASKNDTSYKKDEDSIKTNGLYETELINNVIVNSSRGDFSTKLFEQIKGLEFYQFELDSFGYTFFEPYDYVTITDLNGVAHKSLIMSDTITVTTGLNETISCQIDNQYIVDYTKTNNIQDLIKDTTEDLQDAVYYYTNDDTLRITNQDVEIIRIRFTSKVQATPLFNANLIMKIDTPGLLEFTYILDNLEYYVHPKHSVVEGWCTLHLFVPFYQLEGNKAHDIVVYVNSLDAAGSISRNQIQATVNGQGLEVVGNDWDGTIQIITEVDPITIRNITNSNITIKGIETSLEFKDSQPSGFNMVNEVQPISISFAGPNITIKGIEAGIGYSKIIVDEQIKFNSLSKQNFIYDSKYVLFNENASLITDYTFDQSTPLDVDSGKLQELSIDLEQFKSVENISLEVM